MKILRTFVIIAAAASAVAASIAVLASPVLDVANGVVTTSPPLVGLHDFSDEVLVAGSTAVRVHAPDGTGISVFDAETDQLLGSAVADALGVAQITVPPVVLGQVIEARESATGLRCDQICAVQVFGATLNPDGHFTMEEFANSGGGPRSAYVGNLLWSTGLLMHGAGTATSRAYRGVLAIGTPGDITVINGTTVVVTSATIEDLRPSVSANRERALFQVDLPIPDDLDLVGVHLALQWWVFTPDGNVGVSNIMVFPVRPVAVPSLQPPLVLDDPNNPFSEMFAPVTASRGASSSNSEAASLASWLESSGVDLSGRRSREMTLALRRRR